MKENDYVLLTANAGVMISYRNKKILVDALHDDKTTPFSRVPDRVLRQVVNQENEFSHTDMVLVTHDHPDHYSKKWTEKLLDQNPGIQAVMPVPDFADRKNVHALSRPEEKIHLAGVDMTCKRLQHEGIGYEAVTNYGYLLEIAGLRVMIMGDGKIDEKAITDFMDGFVPDLALLDFPFLTLTPGRDITQRVIKAKQTIFYHLPCPEDDSLGYTQISQRVFNKKYQNDPSKRLLYQSMQRITVGAIGH